MGEKYSQKWKDSGNLKYGATSRTHKMANAQVRSTAPEYLCEVNLPERKILFEVLHGERFIRL